MKPLGLKYCIIKVKGYSLVCVALIDGISPASFISKLYLENLLKINQWKIERGIKFTITSQISNALEKLIILV